MDADANLAPLRARRSEDGRETEKEDGIGGERMGEKEKEKGDGIEFFGKRRREGYAGFVIESEGNLLRVIPGN